MDYDKHLNKNVVGLRQSATLAINEKCNELQKKGTNVYKLGLGQSPFPVPKPVVDSLKLHASEKDYLPVKGLPELREAVADFHRRKDLVNAQAENVIIGPGSKELLFLLQLVFKGEIMLSNPCWVTYEPQARILRRKLHLILSSFDKEWKISPEQLTEICEKKSNGKKLLLILNYPGNPDGLTYTKEQLKEIAKVARKYEIIVLSDEIYGQIHHEDKHVSIARYYPEGTIISSGISKWCGAGGWRLGTFLFPTELSWLKEKISAVASETYTSVSAPIQHAAIKAFKGGSEIEKYLSHVRRILSLLGNECADKLRKAGVNVHPPTGAFYLFADFSPFADILAKRGVKDSESFCKKLFEDTGVAILPGKDFLRPPEELTARLAYIDFDGTKVLQASRRIPLDEKLPPDFTKNECEKTIKAIDKIINWLHSK